MSAKRAKEIKAKVATLRAQRKSVVPWGMPWCEGTGPYHQPPVCEGCAMRLHYADDLAEIDAEIARLLDPRPMVSGDVFALDGDQYALVLGGAA